MDVVTEAGIDATDLFLVNDLVVEGVVGKLVCVHDGGWHLDRTLEPKVAVTLMVRHVLNLISAQLSRIDHHFVVYRQCGGRRRILIGNHKEVKNFLVLLSDHLGVDHGSWTWINHVSVESLEESSGHSLVNENEEESGTVSWLELLNGLT